MSLDALLRERHPAARLVSDRKLRKLLQILHSRGERVARNPRMPFWADSQIIFQEGILAAEASAPPRLLLMSTPDDRAIYDPRLIPEIYSRLLFAGLLSAEPNLPQAAAALWQLLSPAQQREAKFVLASDQRVPESATVDDFAAAFSIVYWEYHEFEPHALPYLFPLIALPDDAVSPLRAALNLEALVHRCRLPGFDASAPVAVPAPRETDEARAAAWLERGNFVRAALLGQGTPTGDAALRELATRLVALLHESPSRTEEWRQALAPLTAAQRWPEVRALFQLQRILRDFGSPLDAVAPVEWLASFGRKPLLRPLEPVHDVILLRRLRAAERQVERSELAPADRHRLEHLLEAEIETADHRLRGRLGPVIHGILGDSGLVPASLPERIGRDALVAELLDRISETGFIRFADLRDAIARNSLKLPDCTPRELLKGDALLKADKKLHDALYGAYNRGEVYLRFFQRFSGFAFGTRLGRSITLFVALPFGSAFLFVEAVKHLAHAVSKLGELLGRLIAGTPRTDEPPHAHGSPLTAETLVPAGILGLLVLLIIHVPPVRRGILNLGAQLLAFLRTLAIEWPRAVWTSPAVRFTIDNRVTRFVSRYILWPAVAATLVMLLLLVLYEQLVLTIIVGAGAITFILASALMVTAWGAQLRENFVEYIHDVGRRFVADFLPGLVGWVLWLFRELLGRVERGLHAVDEWFRYRPGQPRPSLILKVIAGLIWFPIAYVVRFCFYLLFEPQVNPIKHFPVVTVSHKVLLPLIPSLAGALRVTIETATMIITAIPGIFGFLVWEFKENWKLYAANRPQNLPPLPLGHHGETMRGLLRPGFHSGTIPKLFRNFRRHFARPALLESPARRDKLDHEKHHLHHALERLIDRHLLSYWKTVPALATHELNSIRIGCQRIEAAISSLRFSFENVEGTITATIDEPGFLNSLDDDTRRIAAMSLNGLFAVSVSGIVDWKDWLKLWEFKNCK